MLLTVDLGRASDITSEYIREITLRAKPERQGNLQIRIFGLRKQSTRRVYPEPCKILHDRQARLLPEKRGKVIWCQIRLPGKVFQSHFRIKVRRYVINAFRY